LFFLLDISLASFVIHYILSSSLCVFAFFFFFLFCILLSCRGGGGGAGGWEGFLTSLPFVSFLFFFLMK
jgi:hypothetical protein